MLKIGIVGRTNVGKSTLFNRIIKQRKSIVSSVPGTTRDYISAKVYIGKDEVEIVDFGGFEFDVNDIINRSVQENLQNNISKLDLVIFVLDGKCDLSDEDFRIADILRKSKKRVVVFINKVEAKEAQDRIYDFYQLGFSILTYGSASNNDNIDKLMNIVAENASVKKRGRKISHSNDFIKIAIIGKPNVGKSSLFNHLIGEQRSIVTDIAGTTRDAVDAELEIGNKKYLFIDTAGMRRKGRAHEELDLASSKKSLSTIRRADIVLYVIDVGVYSTDYDIKLLNYAWKNGKGIIIVVNKWDIKPPDITEARYKEILSADNSVFNKFSFAFVSSVKGSGFDTLFRELEKISNLITKDIKTSVLNKKVRGIMSKYSIYGTKFYYATQINKSPLELIFFINSKKYFTKKYIEYLEKNLRKELDLFGLPIGIVLRDKKQESYSP